ncbi:MAG: SGNH/GDSL hydrolase family protein [Planctomycetes bacterium]|nr:SGNH/GDSL hydrolase family protein [Planctomycetota bacterium]
MTVSRETSPLPAAAGQPKEASAARRDGAAFDARPRRFRTWRWRLMLVLAGLLVGLGLCELALRFVGYGATIPYVPDEWLASRLQPGFRGWQTREGRAFIEINDEGWRDRPHAKAKPPGTLRIAVVGDSYVEALHVPLEASFWSVLERELSQCSRIQERVEVCAFGVSGYGTAQQALLIERYVWEYSPDIVVLAVCTGNDIQNNSRKLEPEGVKPFYKLENDRLVLDVGFREHPTYRTARTWWARFKSAVIQRSKVAQLVYDIRRGSAGAWTPEGDEPGLSSQVYVPPADPAWRRAWEVTERLLLRIRDDAAAHGAQLVIVTLSNGIQVDPRADVRRRFAERHGVDDLFYPDDRIAAFGAREGIPVIVLARRLREFAERHNRFVQGFANAQLGRGHWNELGHRLAGEWIAEALCASYGQH